MPHTMHPAYIQQTDGRQRQATKPYICLYLYLIPLDDGMCRRPAYGVRLSPPQRETVQNNTAPRSASKLGVPTCPSVRASPSPWKRSCGDAGEVGETGLMLQATLPPPGFRLYLLIYRERSQPPGASALLCEPNTTWAARTACCSATHPHSCIEQGLREKKNERCTSAAGQVLRGQQRSS